VAVGEKYLRGASKKAKPKKPYKLPKTFKTDAGSGGHKKKATSYKLRRALKQFPAAPAKSIPSKRTGPTPKKTPGKSAKPIPSLRTGPRTDKAAKQREKRDIRRLVLETFDRSKPTSRRLATARKLRQQYDVPVSQLAYLNKIKEDKAKRDAKYEYKLKPGEKRDLFDHKPPPRGKNPLRSLTSIPGKLYRANRNSLAKPDTSLGNAVDFVASGKLKEVTDRVLPSAAIGKLLTSNPRKTVKKAKKGEVVLAGGLSPKEASTAATASVLTGQAVLERPGKSVGSTAKSIPPLLAGLVPATVKAVTEPGKAYDELKKDYKRRYGDLNSAKGRKAFRKRIHEEGFLPEALDAAALATISGRAALPLAKLSARGGRLHKFAAGERPVMRVAPDVVTKQGKSKSLYTLGLQRGVDKARGKAAERRASKLKIRAIEPGAGEVVPIDLPGVKNYAKKSNRKLRQHLADAKGRANIEHRVVLYEELDAARKNINTLNKKEKRAFRLALERGLPEGKDALPWLDKLEKDIVAARKQAVDDGHPVPVRKGFDDLETIAYLREHPEAFSPRLREVADMEKARGDRMAALDPTLAEQQAAIRREMPRAQMLDMRRGELPPEPGPVVRRTEEILEDLSRMEPGGSLKFPRGTVYRVKPRATKAAEPAAPAAPLKWKKRQDTDEGWQWQSDGGYVVKAEPIGMGGTNPAKVFRIEHDGKVIEGKNPNTITEAKQMVEELRATVEPPKPKEPKYKIKYDDGPTTHQLPAVDVARLAHRLDEAAAEKHVPKQRYFDEDIDSFLMRVEEEAGSQGLHAPGYFRHDPMVENEMFALSRGSDARAVAGPRKTEYRLLELGIASNDPRVHLQGVAANIKRAFNHNFVAENAERYVFPETKNMTTLQALEWIKKQGAPEDQFALWNPGLFFKEVRYHADDVPSSTIDELALANKSLVKAADQGLITVKDFRTKIEEFEDTTGWSVIPREIHNELGRTLATGLGKGARAWGKFFKSYPSKVILGSNPSWALLQVANNAYLAALSGVGPVTIAKSAAYFGVKNSDRKRNVHPYAGASPFQAEAGSMKIRNELRWGSEAVLNPALGFVSRHGNPLDWLFRFDRINNNVFRRAVLYQDLKRQAYKQMGDHYGKAVEIQGRLQGMWTKGPTEMMDDLVKNRAALEEAATHVDEVLGNYTRFTAYERRYLERNIMFYGFLRFSLRYSFYTLPVKHPILASIQEKLSRLHEDELRRVLGLEPGDPLLPGALSKLYSIKDGKIVSEIPLQLANPAMNVLTQGSGLNQMVGALPPVLLSAIGQITNESVYFGEDWLVDGETTSRESKTNKAKYTKGQRVRIFADEGLQLLAPYRFAKGARENKAPHGADSLAFSERPTQYLDPEIATSIEFQRLGEAARTLGDEGLDWLIPVTPRKSHLEPGQRRYLDKLRTAEGLPQTRESRRKEREEKRDQRRANPKRYALARRRTRLRIREHERAKRLKQRKDRREQREKARG
jgi:hypothetical protein